MTQRRKAKQLPKTKRVEAAQVPCQECGGDGNISTYDGSGSHVCRRCLGHGRIATRKEEVHMTQRRKAKQIPKTITGDALVEAAFRKTLSALRGLTHSERTRVMRAVLAFYQDEGREDG